MALTTQQMCEAIDRYFAAWSSLDPTACAACFTSDARVQDPYGTTPRQGEAALKDFFNGIAKALREMQLRAESMYPSGNRAAVVFRGTGVGMNGKPVSVTGVDVFEFNHAGKITNLWAYWDAAALLAQLKS